MFIRKLKNKNGSTTVQVIDKSSGKYKVHKTIGTSSDLDVIQRYVYEAELIVNPINETQLKLFSSNTDAEVIIDNFVEKLRNSNIRTIGPELIFGTLFDRIGFNQIPDELFRDIVITRLAYPVSKLKTVDYLYRYRGKEIEVDQVYRFLDDLSDKYKSQVEQISFDHTKGIIKNISVVFYDMTTIYFEAEDEDDLRKIGFSKDGKFQKPQIMLGLLVGVHGLPIGYDIFEGNKFEGHTLLPVIEQIQKKYGFGKPVVIADAGLLSKDNLNNLSEAKYEFVIGARIKNESDAIKEKILEKAKNKNKGEGIKDGESFIIKKSANLRLIISYSDKRAKKDKYNREKGLRKLRERIKYGRLTKDNINNRGYNKFLHLKGEIEVEVDEQKAENDQLWDGLKGYITNTQLSAKDVIDNYKHLWQIEKAFRISKTDLKIRPVYHYKRNRIEAHICVSFVAYSIYKELERLLDKYGIGFSPKRAAELTHNMYELNYTLSEGGLIKKTLLKMDKEQTDLYDIISRG